MRLRLLSTALLLALATLPARASDISASQLSAVFCATRLGADMTSLQPLLTDDLAKKIADAEARNAAFAKAHPGEKAPLADGIPWQSRPGKPANCMLVGMSGTYEVPLAIIYYTLESGAHYSDKLELRFVNDQLRLDNVDYADGGDLKSRLAAAFPG